MIVRIGRRGSSFKGASLYYLHDKREAGERHRLTSERVAWVETHNLANEDPQLAWREMWQTARDQKELKQAAGLRTGGNRVHEPVLPIVLSWATPDQPTPEQQRAAAYQFLEKMGFDKHQALIVAHDDTEHRHVHILLNRVNPDNGLVLKESFSHRHAQAWALLYQREHGQEWCPQREINARQRAEGRPTRDDGHQPYPLAKDARQIFRAAEHELRPDMPSDKELLSNRHREEREAFLAEGLKEVHGVRTNVFLEVRTEFKPLWRAMHSAQRNVGFDQDKASELRAQRRELWDHVRSSTRVRQDLAVKGFIAERRELFQIIKDRQRDERAELRALAQAREAGAPYDKTRLAELTGERPAPAPQLQKPAHERPAHSEGVLRPANENQLSPVQQRGLDAARAQKVARDQAGLSQSQSMAYVQRAAMRKVKTQVRREGLAPEMTDSRIAKRISEMRREDEQRRERDRDGWGRERSRDRGGGGKER